LYSILLQHTNSPRVGLDSHFSGESVSFRDYTLPVKIDMSAPEYLYNLHKEYFERRKLALYIIPLEFDIFL
jgi:hypothetical protein